MLLPEDYAIIEAEYRDGADGVQMLLPTATMAEILDAARELGIYWSRMPWQDWEDDILTVFFPVIGDVGCKKKLPHRTMANIVDRAVFLSLDEAEESRDATDWGYDPENGFGKTVFADYANNRMAERLLNAREMRKAICTKNPINARGSHEERSYVPCSLERFSYE